MVKIPLKSGFLALAIFMILALSGISYSGNNGLAVGETSPNPEFLYDNNYDLSMPLRSTTHLYDYKEDKTLLIAFMPDVSEKNNYAEVMTSAFDTYFSKGLAFGELYDWQFYRSSLKVLVVSNNDQAVVREYLSNNGFDFDMASDVNMDMAHSFGITSWNSSAAGSYVYVVDKNNKVTYASNDYKGEGEKLRSVQKEIFSQLNITDPNNQLTLNNNILFPGDKAVDFEFTYNNVGDNVNFSFGNDARLSDYFGKKNVIIAFYPAPYSMSCAMEVSKFDAFAENQTLQNISNSKIGSEDDVEILMVSNSGLDILNKWKKDMNLKNVKLVSDLSGSIASSYSSFNPLGYNNRTLFIINKEGKISYIDWNYVVDEQDFGLVKDHLKLISEK
jgi:peroxiredoxin (alkyl hydroperoxide reductase subunit C)